MRWPNYPQFVHTTAPGDQPRNLLLRKETKTTAFAPRNYDIPNPNRLRLTFTMRYKSLTLGEGQVGPAHSDNIEPPTTQIKPRGTVVEHSIISPCTSTMVVVPPFHDIKDRANRFLPLF